LHDTTATEVEFAHGVLPEKGKLKHGRVTWAWHKTCQRRRSPVGAGLPSTTG